MPRNGPRAPRPALSSRVEMTELVIPEDTNIYGNVFGGRVMELIDKLRVDLAGVCRLHVDDRPEHTPGWKYNEWEMRGVPLRMEVGPRDVAKQQVVLVRRHDRGKEFVPLGELATRIPVLLDELQAVLFERARAFREANTRHAATYDEFKEIFDGPRGFVVAGWDGEAETEARIKEETKATIRVIPLEGGDDVDGGAGREALCDVRRHRRGDVATAARQGSSLRPGPEPVHPAP